MGGAHLESSRTMRQIMSFRVRPVKHEALRRSRKQPERNQGLAKKAKTDQTTRILTAHRQEAPLTHSKTLTTRRKKEKAKKELARIAKQAKKLAKQNAKPVPGK